MNELKQSRQHFLIKHSAWLVFLTALVVRLIYMVEVADSPYFNSPILDAARYDSLAQEIANGNWIGDKVFFQGPLYSYFLAVLYAVFGHNYIVSRLVQIILGALTVLLVFRLAERHFSSHISLLAGLICALYGPLIYYSNQLLIPTLYILLLILSLFYIDKLRTDPTLRNFVSSGLLLGLSALARPNVLLFIPFLLIWFYFFRRFDLKLIAMFFLGFLLMVLPVTIRNYVVSGDFVLISSQGGVAFYMGNNPEATGFTGWVPGTSRDWWGEGKHQTDRIAEETAGKSLKPSEISNYWFGRAFDEMSKLPGVWLQLFGRKIRYLFSGYEISDTEDIYYERKSSILLSLLLWNGIIKFPFGLLMPLAFTGLIISFRKSEQSLLWLFQLAYVFSILLYFVTARYRLPLVPVFAIWAAVGVAGFVEIVKAKTYNKLMAPAAVCLISLVLLNLNPGIRKTNDHLDAVIALGIKYLDQGNNQKAMTAFQQALDLDSTAVRAANSAGVAAIRLGHKEQAAYYFQLALRNDPNNKDARLNLARLQHQIGLLDQAAANLQAAIQIDTTFGEAYAEYGDLFYDTKKYRTAIGLYQLADHYGAIDEKMLNRWAKALFIEKRLPEAITINQKLVTLNPDNPLALYNQGLFYLAADSLSKAETFFERCLQVDPGNGEARKRLSAIRAIK